MASKVRFFFFFASKRVIEEGGRRGASEAYIGQSKASGVIVFQSTLTSSVATGLLDILEGWK